ncbi:MAG: hypothetical protein KJ697_04225 [Nanoarchaeota archaeon]|nr:hypothetical protein [Nanoarchaeota archaeon]
MDEHTIAPNTILFALVILIVAFLFFQAVKMMGYDTCMSFLRWLDFGISYMNPAKLICTPFR